MPIHKSSATDCMHSIAVMHGFYWDTLWNLPENRNIKEKRKDAACLVEGDEIVVPELRLEPRDGTTDAKHRFRRKGIPVRLVIRLQEEGKTGRYAGQRWFLKIGGRSVDGVVSENGELTLPLIPGSPRAELKVGEDDQQEIFKIALGGLDPIDTIKGAQQRLRNLGFLDIDPETQWNDNARQALRDFQIQFVTGREREPSGEYDQQTQEALDQQYQSPTPRNSD